MDQMSANSNNVISLASFAQKSLQNLPGNITNSKLAILTLFIQDAYKIGTFEYQIDFDNELIRIVVIPESGKVHKFRLKNPEPFERFVREGLEITYRVEFA